MLAKCYFHSELELVRHTFVLFVILFLRCTASCLIFPNPTTYPTLSMPCNPRVSAQLFFIKLIEDRVCTFVFLLALTKPAYNALKHVSLMPSSPNTIALRTTKNAVILTLSSFAVVAEPEVLKVLHMSTTDFRRDLSCFRNGKKYGSRFVQEVSSSLRVGGSVRVGRRLRMEEEWDLIKGVRALNFLVSVGRRMRPEADSLMGRWWLRAMGICCRPRIMRSLYTGSS